MIRFVCNVTPVSKNRARILPQNERYWYYAKKSLVKQFNVRVERRSDNKDFFDVVGIDKSEEIVTNMLKIMTETSYHEL